MSQDTKTSNTDEQNRRAEPTEGGREKKNDRTKSAEARIWADANKLARDGKGQIPEKQE